MAISFLALAKFVMSVRNFFFGTNMAGGGSTDSDFL
jgi:hypothetical protein